MLVQDIMKSTLVTISPRTTLPDAVKLTRERGIRHLPVLDGDKLVGIVSDRDLKRAMASSATALEAHELRYLLDRVKVAEIMTRAVVTIGPAFPVEEAARVMVKEKISALPVTDGGRLVGIVTETDVVELFVRALGAGEPSSRLDVVLGRDRTALTEMVETLERAGVPISSVMTLVDARGSREAIVRIATINPAGAVRALEAKGYEIRGPWHSAGLVP
jgi:acetoin utilization protein AcuB